MTGGSEPLLAIPSGALLPDIGVGSREEQESKGGSNEKLIGLRKGEVYVTSVG